MTSKVAIVKISNGDYDAAIKEIIKLLGEDVIPKNDKILIKPNALTSKKTWEEQIVVTTHPEIVKAIAKIVREADNDVVIGDSSGSGTHSPVVLEKAGFKEIERTENIPVVPLTQAVKIEVNGKRLKKTVIAKEVAERKIINVAKMKTHTLTRVTLAIKNLLGCVPGSEKLRIHSVGNTARGFSQCLVDLYAYLKDSIILNIIDADIAMEGQGPSHGSPRKVGLILGSTDAVALDAVATKIMGASHLSVATTKFAYEQGLGEAELNKIEIVGEKLEQAKPKFAMPGRWLDYLPAGFFMKLITKQPKYQKSGCITCHLCERICPEHAITVSENGPIFNYKLCISCFTCHEMCPEGVIYVGKMKYKRTIITIIGTIIISIILTIALTLIL
ncbi:MAG: DUF362 domain-containing protein [Candidatus Heimdallarchaeaceae archaeon]